MRPEGSTHSTRPDNGATMTRSLAPSAALVALVACLAVFLAAATGDVDVGVVTGNSGGLVVEVAPGSPAWSAGIRPGQTVVAISEAADPGGWSIMTTDGTVTYTLSAAGANAPLRLSALAAAAGAGLALLALLAARRGKRESEAMSAIALALAALPALFLDAGAASRLALVLGCLAPAAWIARWVPLGRTARLAVVGTAAGAGIAGAVGLGSAADGARWALLAWAVFAGAAASAVAVLGGRVTPRRVAEAAASVTLLDLAAAGLLALVVAGLAVLRAAPAWQLGAVLAGVVVYARSRHVLRAALDRFLLADLRERAAIAATEDERSRMAREIHDDPLQALAGVIQHLEGADPDTGRVRDSLRDVASRLRAVATELHPPVLDDFGLVPAIETAARTAGGSPAIEVTVEDLTGYARAGRPPADVELAVFRVVQEAIANAVRHARGTRIEVHGTVGKQLVEIAVVDDGVGFSGARAEAAVREGRLGLASMRQRAATIGARLEVERRVEGGTRVELRWAP